jgi:uncharacterized phage protein (TIGR01671 family)
MTFIDWTQDYDVRFLRYCFRPENKDVYAIMQFTGLKDKNGKEIYEGDVGRINLPDIGYVNCVCDWNVAGFRWKKINEMQGISANPSTSWSLVVKDFEVIGNIYENPELLS